jgi:hypothetical protein
MIALTEVREPPTFATMSAKTVVVATTLSAFGPTGLVAADSDDEPGRPPQPTSNRPTSNVAHHRDILRPGLIDVGSKA